VVSNQRMIESKFREVSKQVNGKYQIKDSKYSVGITSGSVMPVTIHLLRVEYKMNIIDVSYEFGNANVAQILLSTPLNSRLKDVTLNTKSHLGRLFSRNKHPWHIKCKDQTLKDVIERSLDHTGLKHIANNSAFEPEIIGKIDGGRYLLETRFYLGFDNKEESLLPLINFYKFIVDFATTGR